MYDYCKAIEIFFAELFDCQRVNVVLVHRFKKYLFRIEADKKPGTFKFVKFELQRGIAGYSAISSHTVITESVGDENKFIAEIDDPNAPDGEPACQMITCPINAADDFITMSREGLTNYPRALIQLINRNHTPAPTKIGFFHEDRLNEDVVALLAQGKRFNHNDVDKIERLSNIMGRCHEMVNKIESMMGMRNEIKQMDHISDVILKQIDTSRINFGNISQTFKKFQEETELKQKQAVEMNRLLLMAAEGPPPFEPETPLSPEKGEKLSLAAP